MSVRPLDGVLVADFSRVLAGPLCTQMLGDAGATIIKVEHPDGGDETRRWGPPFVHGVSTYFLSVNRHKRSLTLDLRRGGAITRKLIERADVVVDNFLPRQRKALGLDRIPRINPTAVHCRISGFDAGTAEKSTPGYDLLAQAATGLMAITGEPDGDPMKVGVAVSDILTAHYAYGAICAALFERSRTGRGSVIDVSLFGSTLASLVNVAQATLTTGRDAARHGNEHPSIVPYQLFHAADASFVVAAGTDEHFRALCEQVLKKPDLATDGRYSTNALRVRNREQLLPMLETIFAGGRARRWVAACRRANVPASLVQGVREAVHSASAHPFLVEIDHPVVGTYRAIRSPLRVDGQRPPAGGAPPTLGQQTNTILSELGFTRSEIAAMARDGIIARPTSATTRRRKSGSPARRR